MSVNIYDGTNLTPIAGKTVPMPYTPAPQSMIGDAWVTSHAYAVGDYAIDANALYKSGTAHTSTATNRPSVNQSGYWTLVSVASEVLSVKNNLLDIIQAELTPDTSLKRLYWFERNQYNNNMGFVNFNNNNNTGITSYNKTSDGIEIAIRSGTWSGVKSKYPVDLSSYKKMWMKVLCLSDARSSDTSLCIQAFIHDSDPSWNAPVLASIYTTLTDVHSKNKVLCFETDFSGGSSFSSCYISIAGYDYGGKYCIESIWFSK